MIVNPAGDRDISTEGFEGNECLEAARPLHGDGGDIHFTEEYFAEEAEEHEYVPAGES